MGQDFAAFDGMTDESKLLVCGELMLQNGTVWLQSCSYLSVSMYGVGICDQVQIIIWYHLAELYALVVAFDGIPSSKENMPRIVLELNSSLNFF